MNSIPDHILNKVRALLAKAENPATTEAEAAAYTAKATEWMARHGIDRALADDRQNTNDTPVDKIVTVANPRAMGKALLLQRIADSMRCQTVRIPHRKGQSDGTQRVHIFGFTSDVERAELMYTSLLLQMMNGLAKIKTSPAGVAIKTYKRSWALGFTDRVGERIEAIEHTAAQHTAPQDGGRSTALVLADRDQAVQARKKDVYASTAKGRSTFDVYGYGAGTEAGNRADIGNRRVGATRGAITP